VKIQTLCLVVDAPCNAKCPFCVSRMTGDVPERKCSTPEKINERNLDKAIMAAKTGGATTALITGKGEPTLNTEQVMHYLRRVRAEFPFVEMQTNGLAIMRLGDGAKECTSLLEAWYEAGLTTLAISIVSHKEHVNRDLFGYAKLNHNVPLVIRRAHDAGIMVRLACTMYDGGVRTPDDVEALIMYCNDNSVEQLTLGPVAMPETPDDRSAGAWVAKHMLRDQEVKDVRDFLVRAGIPMTTLLSGTVIYDVDGVSVCLRECLSRCAGPDEVRSIIFYPNGRLMYDWECKGAVLL
jgi:molybdenum cofactor biosynthesis enzyme MoaA